ncbi:2,3-bisphosphoglycerate-independent phosphoglycerate mutase [Candidatus Micrarchaeota archaeon]|nr:2,3-bisphosphoglycerate-independent phosphoglycerate mutase [Candidatus Micrarchaeota archaeon]
MNKAILFIIDGLGDLPTPKTALQAAKKKNFDWLAKNGVCGLMSTIDRGITPGSDVSHLQLFGYDPKEYYPGRGPLEALGVGINLQEGDVAFRANFATVDGKKIIDRRAGRISTDIGKALEKYVNMKIGPFVTAIFKSSVEHRGALVLRGGDVDDGITDTDPHGHGDYILECKPMNSIDQRGITTSEIVNEFTKRVFALLNNAEENKKLEAQKKLKANIILLRSAGQYRPIVSIKERFDISAACVAGGALYKGIAKYVGMDIVNVQGATGTAQTDLKAKGNAVVTALKNHDVVFLHVKACDSFGHDGNFNGKVKMLERIDKELLPILIKSKANIIITGDHSTPCIRKAHSGHEVPILIYGDERKDKVGKFDEVACMNGGLGHLRGKDVMPIILNLIRKEKMYGS